MYHYSIPIHNPDHNHDLAVAGDGRGDPVPLEADLGEAVRGPRRAALRGPEGGHGQLLETVAASKSEKR